MKLLIISNMAHYLRNGQIVGWGPTVREIDYLAERFEDVRHIACLHDGRAPESALPYTVNNVRLIAVPPSGGPGLGDKLGILRLSPLYLRMMIRELSQADAVHVRCPANISLLAIILLTVAHRPRIRWVKYAGNWQPKGAEAWSYTFQRWWLNLGLTRGSVTINGRWANQRKHLYSLLNPCLTEDEIIEAREGSREKELTDPARLLYVGRIDTSKGVGRTIEIISKLNSNGQKVRLDVVGDGPERKMFEDQVAKLRITQLVTFHGWLPRPSIAPIYMKSHLMVFPSSCSEGWPKVLSEGMSYGVVPIASSVSSIPQYLKEFQVGKALDPFNLDAFTTAISEYLLQPVVWKRESERAMKLAPLFSYTKYVKDIQKMLSELN